MDYVDNSEAFPLGNLFVLFVVVKLQMRPVHCTGRACDWLLLHGIHAISIILTTPIYLPVSKSGSVSGQMPLPHHLIPASPRLVFANLFRPTGGSPVHRDVYTNAHVFAILGLVPSSRPHRFVRLKVVSASRHPLNVRNRLSLRGRTPWTLSVHLLPEMGLFELMHSVPPPDNLTPLWQSEML